MTQKYQWHLVRTINGEWVSEEYAVYMTKRSGNMRLKDASRLGINLVFIQHMMEIVGASVMNLKA